MRGGAGWMVGLALLFGGASAATAQSLDSRFQRAGDGTIAFHFEVADEVRVCDRSIRIGDGNRAWHWGRWDHEKNETCTDGPLEARFEVRNGRILDAELGRVGSEASDVDLGRIAVAEVADWMVEMPWRNADEDAVGAAWMSIRFMDDVNVDQRMVDAVRDRSLDEDVREQVLFWAGQIVSERLFGEELRDVAMADDEDQDIRDQAIFALSQREAGEAVPLLMEVAEEAPHSESRKTALFWLAQHDTDEVGDFFARLILDGRGG